MQRTIPRLPGAVLALAGCAAAMSSQSYVAAPPLAVVRGAPGVFRQFDIPVRRQDIHRGEVDSGRFDLEGAWGSEPLESRIDCGDADDGGPRAVDGTVALVVTLTARASTRPVHNDIRGRFDAAGSRVHLRSQATLRDPDGAHHSCRFRPEFLGQVMAAIANAAGAPEAGPVFPDASGLVRPPRSTTR